MLQLVGLTMMSVRKISVYQSNRTSVFWREECELLGKTVQTFVVLLLALCTCHAAQSTSRKSTAAATKKNLSAQKLRAAITLAMSAGPAAISKQATIIGCGGGSCSDMSELAKGQTKQL